MAKAKTGSFYIRRKIDVSSATPDALTIDTSAYVDPADRQGLMIESVDFIFYNSSNNLPLIASAAESTGAQLLTGAYTTLQPYDEEDLIASGGASYEVNGGHSMNDVYPDVLGTKDGRITVDDNLSLVGASATAFSGATCAVVIKAKVVTLTNKDYMALAMQTVAN